MFGELPDTTASFSGDIWTSNHQVLFQSTKYVTVTCSMAEDQGRVGGDTTVLARIAVENTPDAGMIEWHSPSLEESARNIHHNTNNCPRFSLHDDCDNVINFNNHFVKLVIMLFKHNNTPELIKQSTLLQLMKD